MMSISAPISREEDDRCRERNAAGGSGTQRRCLPRCSADGRRPLLAKRRRRRQRNRTHPEGNFVSVTGIASRGTDKMAAGRAQPAGGPVRGLLLACRPRHHPSAARPRTIRDKMPRAMCRSVFPGPVMCHVVVDGGIDLVDPALGDRTGQVPRVEPHPPGYDLGHALRCHAGSKATRGKCSVA